MGMVNMKNAGITVLALIGGLVGGYILFELLVRISLRTFESVPIVFIGIMYADAVCRSDCRIVAGSAPKTIREMNSQTYTKTPFAAIAKGVF
ncbi:MAG: hypothetical protein ACQEXQ_25765 [Bacillota bacterium]